MYYARAIGGAATDVTIPRLMCRAWQLSRQVGHATREKRVRS
jgi:hypothetical protein